jgi:hypothetical protein
MGRGADLGGRDLANKEPLLRGGASECQINFEGFPLKVVPYTVRQLSFGGIQEDTIPGLYDGPFPWEYTFSFHLAGMVRHEFFTPYAVTFDFKNMQIFLQ